MKHNRKKILAPNNEWSSYLLQNRPAIVVAMLLLSFAGEGKEILTTEQRLGKLLYEDENLSLNRNQSCASCHSLQPAHQKNSFSKMVAGFVDPENIKNGTAVSSGSRLKKTGTLNAPSVGYTAFSPLFHWDEVEGLYAGGQFWNGRADNLIEQAKQPFLNPAEMAMPNEWSVVNRIKENKSYRKLFWRVYHLDLGKIPRGNYKHFNSKTRGSVIKIYHHAAKAISEFERSSVFNKFNSKFDFVLAGKTVFSRIEQKGFALFSDPNKGNCAACHVADAATDKNGNIVPPMFTDFTYDNIGLPRNVKIPKNPAPNLGLGGRADIKSINPNGDEIGKHKVMSLRNIAITPPYGHNGVFATLEQVVHFYNTRDTLGRVQDNQDWGYAVSGWPDPEIPQNVNHGELGNLGLTVDEEKAIVAFMKTLTDDYPKWGKDPLVSPGTPSPFPNVKPPVR
jgi:cytochrome c peroxidase